MCYNIKGGNIYINVALDADILYIKKGREVINLFHAHPLFLGIGYMPSGRS
jgi:hypothetical protein